MSRNEDILRAIIAGDSMGEATAQSRNEAILMAMLDVLNGDEIDLSQLPAPQSRFENLLLQVVRKLEESSAGGDDSGGSDSSAEYAAVIDRSVEDIIIPDGVTEIGEYVFYQCGGVKSVTIPDSVQTIRSYSFVSIGASNGGVKFPIIANGVKTIGSAVVSNTSNTFGGSANINKIVLPSLETITDGGFGGCTGIEYIYLGPNVTSLKAGCFGGVPTTCKVECGFASGAVSGFPANMGFAGNTATMDITYNVAEPSE